MRSTGRRLLAGATLVSLIGAGVTFAPAVSQAQEPWDAGRHWVSARIGFVKSRAEFAPDGSLGYGFGYSWLLGNNLAWSATAGYDVLGKYGAAAEIEIPLTTEFTRHFRWGGAARPYLGLGWGAIFHKTYRTSADESGFRQAIYLATGANTRLNPRSMLGLDIRIMLEQDARSINPTFPNGSATATVLSAKISYSRVF